MKMMIAVAVAMVVVYDSCNFSRTRNLLRNSGELLFQHWGRPEPQTDIGALHSASESDNLQSTVCTPEPATRSASHWPGSKQYPCLILLPTLLSLVLHRLPLRVISISILNFASTETDLRFSLFEIEKP